MQNNSYQQNNTKTKIDISHRASLLSRMENSADYTVESNDIELKAKHDSGGPDFRL